MEAVVPAADWNTGVNSHSAVLQPRAAETREVSSDMSLGNLTARQQPQGKQQHTGSAVYTQLNTNPTARLLPPPPLPPLSPSWEIKPTHQPNAISFALLISLSTEARSSHGSIRPHSHPNETLKRDLRHHAPGPLGACRRAPISIASGFSVIMTSPQFKNGTAHVSLTLFSWCAVNKCGTFLNFFSNTAPRICLLVF